ncbi:phosphatase PAP2 family protein [soil metagenome]
MIAHRAWFSPDQFFAVALFGSLLVGRLKIFLFDWLPFILFFLGYEMLRGIVPHIIGGVHIFPMIRFDTFIFGFIPTIKSQAFFYNPAKLQWYDYFLVICYISYFIVPMLVGYFLWIKDRMFFKRYSFGIVLLAYTCFITFIIFPAMPPWMASSKGYLPPIKEVTGVVMSHFLPSHISFPTVYSLVASDPVAAVPSLHAAVPTLIFLFLVKKYKKRGFLILPYVIGTWLAVIYLGEHYFADVLLGIIYATVIFIIVDKKIISSIYQKKKSIFAWPN